MDRSRMVLLLVLPVLWACASSPSRRPPAAAPAPAPTRPPAVDAVEQGAALCQEGLYDEAIGRLTAALQVDARLPYAYYWRGQAYHRTGRISRMADDYQAFLRLAPGSPEAPAVRTLLASLQ